MRLSHHEDMGARSAVTVGRETEVDLLLAALAAADLGEAKVAVVEGDAGIEEALQTFARFRTASRFDYSADVAGVVAFVWLSRRVAR